jgi:hypothetical protein
VQIFDRDCNVAFWVRNNGARTNTAFH